ncbi:MAG: SUMF1/EgtB/PvdO family nonheme iron enzyme [Bacteroidota bacterium]
MKSLLISFVILIFSLNLLAQRIATKKITWDPFKNDALMLVENGAESFIISKYKTTNKDYLCFLQWNYRVFSHDYMQAYKDLLPDTAKYPDLFNPLKLNEPVKGVSYKQAQAFCQWRSDRMNEYILIREGIMNKDPNQINEENYTTESYLAFQYIGMTKCNIIDAKTPSGRSIMQTDYVLMPSFHLASKTTINICDSLTKRKSLETHKKIKSDLDWWFKFEIQYAQVVKSKSPIEYWLTKVDAGKQSDIKKYIKTLQKELATKSVDFNINGVLASEKDYRMFYIHNLKPQVRYYNIYCDSLQNPFFKTSAKAEIKNEFGKMPFVYVGDNFDGTPICLMKTEFEDNSNKIAETGFYCEMNVPYRVLIEIMSYKSRSFGLGYRYR